MTKGSPYSRIKDSNFAKEQADDIATTLNKMPFVSVSHRGKKGFKEIPKDSPDIGRNRYKNDIAWDGRVTQKAVDF